MACKEFYGRAPFPIAGDVEQEAAAIEFLGRRLLYDVMKSHRDTLPHLRKVNFGVATSQAGITPFPVSRTSPEIAVTYHPPPTPGEV